MGKGSATRNRILEIAESAVLAKGFGATSIEEIIAEAGITKSGFFYHFKDKNELARGLLLRYGEQNDELLADVFDRARQLSDDPLQALLVGLTLFAEKMAALPGGHPGCLIASMSYQDRLFDRDVRELVGKTLSDCTNYFSAMVADVVAVYPTREPIDPDVVGRAISCAIDGAIVMSKAMGVPGVLPEQMLMVRNYVKLLFAPAVPFRQAQEAKAA